MVGVEKIESGVAAKEEGEGESEVDRWYLVEVGGRNVGGKGKI